MKIPKFPNGNLSKQYKNWKSRLQIKRPHLVKVHWMDACGGLQPRFNIDDSEWFNKTEFGVINSTVGWLLLYNDSWVVVCGELSDTNQPREITEVPTKIVLQIDILEKGYQNIS